MKNYIYRYLKCPSLILSDARLKVNVSKSAKALNCKFEGKNRIYDRAVVSGALIGRGSYVGPDSHLPKCEIGRYCSIGPKVMVLGGKHPVGERISTHPAFYSTKKQAGFTYVDRQSYEEFNYANNESKIYVEIGSDVWIGARVTIIGGVKIGHGAIISAGSLVTKDVEPYSIVGGVPAGHLKYRFEKQVCEELVREAWWERDEAWIMANIARFAQPLA